MNDEIRIPKDQEHRLRGRLSNRDVDGLIRDQYEDALADDEQWAREAFDVRQSCELASHSGTSTIGDPDDTANVHLGPLGAPE